MKITDKWLSDVLKDTPLNNPNDIDKEIENNTWSFSLGSENVKELEIADLYKFINTISEHRKTQIPMPMTFYCWFDEQACQLRIGLVSADKDSLPFGCTIEHETKLERIIDQFLSSDYHDGIPKNELNISKISDNNIEEEDYVLKVWSKVLKPKIAEPAD